MWRQNNITYKSMSPRGTSCVQSTISHGRGRSVKCSPCLMYISGVALTCSPRPKVFGVRQLSHIMGRTLKCFPARTIVVEKRNRNLSLSKSKRPTSSVIWYSIHYLVLSETLTTNLAILLYAICNLASFTKYNTTHPRIGGFHPRRIPPLREWL